MLEAVYRSPGKREELARCWLGPPIVRYLEQRAEQGYAEKTLQSDAHILRQFAAFLKATNQRKLHKISQAIDSFASEHGGKRYQTDVRRMLRRFIKYLRATGQIPARDPSIPSPRFFRYVAAYEAHLRDRRGLPERTIFGRRTYCIKFMQYIYNAGVKKFHSLNARVVQEFVRAEGQQYCRHTMVSYCSILRNFLAYVYASGQFKADFSTAVVTPKTYRHERCPKFLTRREIESMLETVDRRTAIGRRNYAMLLLLTSYGLRGIEVVRMRLEDIEWRAEKIHVRARKGSHSSVYPLTSVVAEALVGYLKDGRPQSQDRHVFLTPRAPFRPLQTYALRHVVRKYVKASGRDVRGIGAHTLRYSCAQRLFDGNFSIKVIGDYLGHRYLGTTQRYVKIDLANLRSVAVNDGEAML